MEKIKALNAANRNNGVLFGETSRCDILEEEHGFHAIKKIAGHEIRSGRTTINMLPQPMLAKSHTEENVCVHFFIIRCFCPHCAVL